MRLRFDIDKFRRSPAWRALLLFSVFSVLAPSLTHATWNKLFQNPNVSQPFLAASFVDEQFGVIGGQSEWGTWRTTDGGATWTQAMLPGKPPGVVTQIKMIDHLHGWMTGVLGIPGKPAPSLYETTDGALSWIAYPSVNAGSDFYINGNNFIIPNSGYGFISYNGGANFSSHVFDSTVGIDFVDSLHGVITGYTWKDWYRTQDGGTTWMNLSPPVTTETWGVYGVKGTSTFYTAGEGDWDHIPSFPLSSVLRSTDYGATWNAGGFNSNLGFRTTGHIAGFGEMLYVQSYTGFGEGNWQKGFYRSTDRGRTWFNVGGPSNKDDSRFVVLGCQGNVVIGFDATGGVWKTNDGGDRAFAQATLPDAIITVDSIDVCQSRETSIVIGNPGCDTLFITGATGSAQPLLEVLDLFGSAPNYPYIIPPGGSVSLKLRLRTSIAGQYTANLILDLEQAGVASYDTVTVHSALRFSNPLTATPKLLRFDSTAICDMHDSSVTISNPGCFTVQIVSSLLKKDSSFALDTAWKNDSIPAGQSKTFTVRFSPTQLGPNTDSLIVNALVLGKLVRLSFPVTGIGKPDNPRFLMVFNAPINYDTLSICDKPLPLPFAVTNPGCTFLTMNLTLLDSMKLTSPPNDMFKWYIPGGARQINYLDTLVGLIEVIPLRTGSYQVYLKVTYSIQGQKPVDTLVPFKIFVKPGSKRFSLDNKARDYGTIQFCQVRDTTIFVANAGCDTMLLEGLGLTGNAFIIMSPLKTPLNVLPNSSVPVVVRYLPNVAGQSNGNLLVTTTGDSLPIRNVPLTGYATPTDTVRFAALSPNLTVKPGDTALVLIKPSRGYKNKGISSIDITLEYNGDVMTPYLPGTETKSDIVGAIVSEQTEQPVGPRLRRLPLRVVGKNMTLDSATAIIYTKFVVTVSDTTSTQFRIAHFAINDSNPIFNKCVLGAISDSGTIGLEFVCGDSQLYRFLRDGNNFSPTDGIAPAIGAAHPNPITCASNASLSIPYRALRKVSARLEIIDARGATVYSTYHDSEAAGSAEFTLTPGLLKSGAYHYRILPTDGGRGVAMGEFVVLN